jgi:hypothetical protein
VLPAPRVPDGLTIRLLSKESSRTTKTPSALVRALGIVAGDPPIEIGLQLGDGAIDLLAEGDAIELIEPRLVDTDGRRNGSNHQHCLSDEVVANTHEHPIEMCYLFGWRRRPRLLRFWTSWPAAR